VSRRPVTLVVCDAIELRLPAGMATGAFTLASCNLDSESTEALLPKTAKLVEPGVNLLERLRIHGIDAARAFNTNAGKSALAQHTQVLRDGGLRNIEFLLDYGYHRACILFACREKLENAAADRVAEDVKGAR